MGQYSDLFEDDNTKQTAGLNLRMGIEAQPDMAARNAALAKRYSLPVGVIEEYKPDYEARAKVDDGMATLNASPKLRGWLAAAPDRAKVAHDDLSNMGALEAAATFAAKPFRAMASAAPEISAGLYGAAAAPFELLGANTVGGFLREQQKNAHSLSDRVMGMDPQAGFMEKSVLSGFQSAGQNLMLLPAGLATGSTNLVLGIMGAVTGGQSYGKGRDAGLSPEQAAAYGIQDATAEIVTEKYLGMAGFLKNVKAGASAGKLFGYELAKEVPGEMAATLWQNFNEWGHINPDKSVADWVAEQPAALAQTIIATLVGGGTQIGAIKSLEKLTSHGQQKEQDATLAQAHAQTLTDMLTATQASKLLERSPETLNTYLQELVAEGVPNVHLDGKALMEAGVDLNVLAQSMPSLATQGEALQRGGDLVVPTEELLTGSIGTGFEQALIDHARTSENAMSRVEAQAFMAEKGGQIMADMERAANDHVQDADFKADRDALKDQMLGQLNAVNAGLPKANELHATLVSNFFAVMAARQGMKPSELYAKFPLQVGRTGQGMGGQQLDQVAPTGEIDESTGLPLNSDGTVTVYHHTSSDKARAIRESGQLKSAGEPDLYFTTTTETNTGYGDTAVPFRVKPERLILDDEFPDGRQDFRVEAGGRARRVKFREDGEGVLYQRGTTTDMPENIAPGPQGDAQQGAVQGNAVARTNMPEERDGFTRMYHAGSDPTKGGYWQTVPRGGVFDGFFALTGRWGAYGTGAEYFSDIPSEKILSSYELEYELEYETVKSALESVYNFDKNDFDEVWGAVIEDKSLNGDDDDLMRIFRQDSAGEASWEAQRVRGLVAKKLGYQAVEMDDENGTSYLIVSGTPITRVLDENEQSTPTSQGVLSQQARGTFSPDQMLITLGKSADLSTFIHESGHFFLEAMASMAGQIQSRISTGDVVSEGERGILADFNTSLAWMGVTATPELSALDNWHSMTLDEKRDAHEKWARGFEAYAFEGKAPEMGMAKMFQTFRAWMVNIYKELKNLNVKLDDDIRGVFDRMLATSEQIAETEAARSMGALFESAEQAGMTLEEFKAYHDLATQATMDAVEKLQAKTLKDMQWLDRAKGKVLKALQKQHDELRAQTRREVSREVMSQPVYQAWQFLTGKATDKTQAQLDHEKALADWKQARADYEDQTKQALKDKLLADNPDVKGIAKGQLLAKNKRQIGIDTQQAMLGWDRDNARPTPPEKPIEGFDADGQTFGRLSIDHLLKMASPVDLATLPKEPKTGTGPVNPETDSILVAIAKLGGIARESAGAHLGVHGDDFNAKSGVFGKPLFRKEGGRSADSMGEALAELGYIPKDDNGQYDLRDLESAIGEEIGGTPQYSNQYDYSRSHAADQAYEAMANALPVEVVNALKARKMTAKEGMHPDLVAEYFGFSSGDEMVRALTEAQPPKEAIDAATDQRMLAEHADLATPAAMERAADEAVHNEARARFVATELSALDAANRVKTPDSKGRNTVDVIAQAAKEYAQGIIARLKVRDIKPASYAAAEARAARAAQKAAGDLAKQAEAKRNQLINLHATKAAYAALEEVDRAVRYLKKFDRPGVRAAMPAEYLAQIDALLAKYDLRQKSGSAIDRTVALRTWVQGRLNAGVVPVISESLLTVEERAAYSAQINSRDENGDLTYADDEERIKLLADAIERSAQRSYKDMTLEELRGLKDTIAQMEHLGRLKDKLLTAKDGRTWQATKDDLVATLMDNAKQSGKNDRTANTWLGQKLQAIKQFGASHIKSATWMRIFDGGKDGGVWWNTVARTANERATFETDRRAQATEALTKILAPIISKVPKADLMGKGKSFPTLGAKVSLNWQERFAFLLNYGNESNLQRLMDGGIAGGPRRLTMGQVHEVLKTATAAEWQAAQAIWDHFETYRNEIAAKEMRVSGVEPDWIPARQFAIKTADGKTLTLRGGYYPVKFDSRVNLGAAQHAEAQDAKNAMKAAYSAATTQRSFTKARVEEVHGRPLLLNLTGLYSGINDVIHDLAWHEWVIDMNRLLRSDVVDEAIREHYGPEVKKELTKWRDDIVAGSKRLDHGMEAAVGWARRFVSVSALSYNVMSAAMQPLGITQSISRVGASWIAKGVAQYVSSPIDSTAMVKEKSAFMEARTRTMFRDLNELRNKIAGQTTAGELMGRYGFYLTSHAQMIVDVPTWIGAYEKGIAGGHDEATAIALADQSVKDSQGGGEEVDQSGITRGGPMVKLFTAFYEFMNTQANVLYLAHKTTDTKAQEFMHFALVGMVPVIMAAALRDALTPGDSGDWDDWEHIMKKVLAELGANMFGLVAFGREFTQVFKAVIGEDKGIGYSGPTGMRLIPDAYKLAKQAAQGEMDDAFRKAFINLLGDVSGIPSVQINRTITGAAAIQQGKTDSPAAVVFGFQEKH